MKRWLILSAVLFVGAVSYFFFYKKDETRQHAVTSPAAESSEKISNDGLEGINYSKKKSIVESKFDTSADLASLLAEIKGRAEAGDSIAQRMYGQILEECQGVSANPKHYQELGAALATIVPELKNQYINIAKAKEKRCMRIAENQPSIKNDEVSIWYAKAALQNDGLSTAKIMNRGMGPEKLDDASLKKGIDQIIGSKDPEALMALADIAGTRLQSRTTVTGPLFGTATHEYAWRIAACRTGADCSPRSQLATSLCLSGARSACTGTNSVQEIYRLEAMSPSDYQRALTLSDQIIVLINKPKG